MIGDVMTQARRAKAAPRRRRGMWILIAVLVVTVLAGTLIALGIRGRADLGQLPVTRASTASASTTSASTTSASTSASASTPTGQPENAAAEAALRACRAKVEAGDQVLSAAKTGMQHWSEHVQAQTDANAGKITIGEMEDIFERTMKAGDKDEKRYSAAVKSYEDHDGSCREVSGASAEVTKRLARCAERGRAQEPVGAAAKDGMADWTRHLGEMRRAEQGKIHNPQQKWLQTWRAAPKNIQAYDDAAEEFSAPGC